VTGSLTTTIRKLVAEDLSTPAAVGLLGEDRREFARQRVFSHLDRLAADDDGLLQSIGEPESEQHLARSVLDALFGLGALQTLVDNPEIEGLAA
jgi:hypothetical protein